MFPDIYSFKVIKNNFIISGFIIIPQILIFEDLVVCTVFNIKHFIHTKTKKS